MTNIKLLLLKRFVSKHFNVPVSLVHVDILQSTLSKLSYLDMQKEIYFCETANSNIQSIEGTYFTLYLQSNNNNVDVEILKRDFVTGSKLEEIYQLNSFLTYTANDLRSDLQDRFILSGYRFYID